MLYNGGGYHIPDIVRWFKSITTNRYIHGVKEKGWTPFSNTFWQRNYFDRVVRDQQEFDNVKRYIEENPQRWEVEEEDAHVDKRGRTRGYAHTLLLLLVLAFPCCAQNIAGWEDGDPGYTPISPDSAFATGAENLWNHEVFPTMFLFREGEYKGRTAVVANQTSVVGTTHLVDTLLRAGRSMVFAVRRRQVRMWTTAPTPRRGCPSSRSTARTKSLPPSRWRMWMWCCSTYKTWVAVFTRIFRRCTM